LPEAKVREYLTPLITPGQEDNDEQMEEIEPEKKKIE